TDRQRSGMRVLVHAGCLSCHAGPMLSDMGFHNLGVASAAGAATDKGRVDAYEVLKSNPFNGQGAFMDGAPLAVEPGPNPRDVGAFRTPTLRNVTLTGPYMHNGSIAALADVIAFHVAGGGRGAGGFVGEVDPLLEAQRLSAQEIADLVDFLGALEG